MEEGHTFLSRYRVESPRLRDYDYTLPGWYFVTMCTRDRMHDFGHVNDGYALLSKVGRVAHDTYTRIPQQFCNAHIDEFVVMPNHIHGIICILRRDVINHVSTGNTIQDITPMGTGALGEIVRWYKGRVTYYGRRIDPTFAWQRSYYDHIIRNTEDLERIRHYIRTNPENWERDTENKNHPFPSD